MTNMIKIIDAPNYFDSEQKYPTNQSKRLFVYRIKRLIKAELVIGDLSNNKVDFESLNDYLTMELSILENYMSILEFQKLFGIPSQDKSCYTKKYLINLEIESSFRFEYVILNYPINFQTFYILKSSVEQFLSDYISMNELFKREELSYQMWMGRLKRYGIKPVFIGRDTRYISKDDFVLVTKDVDYSNSSKYYSYEEFYEILGKPINTIRYAIEKEYDILPEKVKNKLYYKKEIVDKLKLLQEDLKSRAMSLKEAEEVAQSEGLNFNANIKAKPMENIIRPFFKFSKIYYLREDFNNWMFETKQKVEKSVFLETDFETFKYRLILKEVDINELGQFTSKAWLEYIYIKLNGSKANLESIDSYINIYVNATKKLVHLVSDTKKREIYSVTSNDINTLFNEIPKGQALEIYQFLGRVYQKLQEQRIYAFDFNKINDPKKFEIKMKDKSIYEYEVFKKVFNYVKDIPLHKERAIKDTLNIIAGKKYRELYHHASSWLYCLLHMNNAWRHSDVIRFPYVDLSGTEIVDLKWFLENDLSDEDTDYIIKQVYRADFIISKTQVKNYFFCSEELKKPFATSIAICQLRTNIMNPIHDSIVSFSNKRNIFSDRIQRHFFDLLDEEEFHFSSRKMNRSLMSYVYVILSKMQKGKSGLKTIQNMRGHLEKETTNFYVDIPENEINCLTRQLFARGSFGFIYDSFLDILQGLEINREKRTTKIQELEKYFGDIYKVEEIAGFLNVIQNDRKTILDRILSMGLDEALDFVNKIETGQLPSKQDDVQCMFAETGCVKVGQGVNCFDCAFSIPNYYALSALGASIEDRLENYLESIYPKTEKPYYEQRKRARLFYIQLELWAQAIGRFGFDVYNFMEFDRDTFIENTKKIKSLREQYKLT